MNLFLTQKTNPLKSKLAKIFAIFLVCFFVGGALNNTFAAGIGDDIVPPGPTQYDPLRLYAGNPLPTGFGKVVDPAETKKYLDGVAGWEVSAAANLTFAKVPVPFNGEPKNTVYRIFTSVAEGTWTNDTPIRVTYKLDPTKNEWVQVPNLPSFPAGITNLYLDPGALNKAGGPLRYDVAEGGVIWTDKNGVVHNEGPITSLGEYNALMDKLKADDPTKATQAQQQMSKAQVDAAKYATQAGSNALQTGDPTNNNRPDVSCGFTQPMCMLAQAVYYMTIKPASLLLAIGGWFLDIAFLKTIVQLRDTLGIKDGAGNATNTSFYGVIKMVWAIFRDLINMSFIFILLYASIMTILKADTGRVKKAVMDIIIVAVLINFSLFFTQIIIDVSNNLAVTVYSTITQPKNGTTDQNNIAVAFMAHLGLEKLLADARPTGQANSTGSNYTAIISICIFGSVFILILAVVFFVMAVLLALRFVEFMILMMMSPVGIGSIALPQLNKYVGGDFWKNLLSQCFFAPIMLFFLWISIQMLNALTAMANPAGNAGGASTAAKTDLARALSEGKIAMGTIGAYVLGFTVTIYLLIKALTVAKSMSAKGASGLQSNFLHYSGANWVQNKMASATARQTLGRAAYRMADSDKFKNYASRSSLGRVLYKGTSATANAKFGGDTSFAKSEKASIKRKEEFREQLAKKSYKQEQEEQRIREAQRKLAAEAEKNSTQAMEHVNARTLERDFAKLDEYRTDATKKQREINAKLTSNADYVTAKATLTAGGSPAEIAAANASIQKIEKKTKEEVEKSIKELEDGVVKAFTNLKIHIDPKDATTHPLALSRLAEEKMRIETRDKKEGYDAKSLAELKDIAKELETQSKTEKLEAERIEKLLKTQVDQGKIRQEQYAQSLSSRRISNLFMPSRASREASSNIRKEINKPPSRAEQEKMLKAIQKMVKGEAKEEEKEKGGEPKNSKPTTS